ncbi:biotin/lipoate--protein ligase family protein [Yoonia sediminilitoris]|uniref:Biotin-(Acetyl-CoA carboxylase) ligase n=1 Tax=Yoonia sediminilitoris TaxID=1286148 RepID=A0A2T6K9U3_9RHOB|nr:biotin/lipoate--protein ligase family protein [Yoonia sediminilitoris]PUB11519.1 biotin-(acetyl-CoA carboxylase) ligase [Yoonia sediminilitoris]RCW91719.1 biotin-(acetyl-CoA carboxylase) ligase [Yoonia sediminilitoris]
MSEPSFPPLFSGQADPDPFNASCAKADKGCDAGLVVYDLGADRLRAAIVFAPDVTLGEAMVMLPLCGVGFQNALGALSPPETAVHLEWAGNIRINGAVCGALDIASDTTNADEVPNWLVVGLELRLWPESEETGGTPDQTALYAEGCADVDAVALLEAWVRHTLVGINAWTDTGVATLHKQWEGLAHGIGEPLTLGDKSGTFLGIDERFGILLRNEATSLMIPLTYLLKDV